MEILHAATGIVKSGVVTTFMQVFSRVWTLWAVMEVAPTAQNSIFTVLACTSWALVEVPRYLFYGAKILDILPSWLNWLRYSLFAVLYPTGITGELGCMYFAFFYTNGASDANLIYLSYVIAAVALTYIPGSPTMYNHMVKERRKNLAEKPKQN